MPFLVDLFGAIALLVLFASLFLMLDFFTTLIFFYFRAAVCVAF